MNDMDYYYLSNNIWVYGNAIMILPFIISCIFRYKKPNIKEYLWTDHFARIFIIFMTVYYIFDVYIKYKVDGSDTVCLKAFYIHHLASIMILPFVICNSYIPWWVNPIGFLHGFCILWPEYDIISYIYVVFLLFFNFMVYQQPYYSQLKGYGFIRFLFGGIYIFCLLVLLGDCTNYLPLQPN